MSFGHGSFCESPFSAIPAAVVVEVPEVPVPPLAGGGPAIGFAAPFQQQAIFDLRKRDVDIAVAGLMYLRKAVEAAS